MAEGRLRIAVVGDVHGHLQLALCVVARWQQELNGRFDAVLLCGDVGTFSDESQLDSATRRRGKSNPCELEFLTQWAGDMPAPWLRPIFERLEAGGLGLMCPVIMVHGNHEGFEHLSNIVHSDRPTMPVATGDLPTVDGGGHIRLLPSGWRCHLASGIVVGGIGGIEEGQAALANYHPMAYLDQDAIASMLERQLDVLITHQGPSMTQGRVGAPLLDLLAEEGVARVWLHGHGVESPEIRVVGPQAGCQIVPLGDIAFPDRGPNTNSPGEEGWCVVTISEHSVGIDRSVPPFLRDFRQHKWKVLQDGRLICPSLARLAWKTS